MVAQVLSANAHRMTVPWYLRRGREFVTLRELERVQQLARVFFLSISKVCFLLVVILPLQLIRFGAPKLNSV